MRPEKTLTISGERGSGKTHALLTLFGVSDAASVLVLPTLEAARRYRKIFGLSQRLIVVATDPVCMMAALSPPTVFVDDWDKLTTEQQENVMILARNANVVRT